VTLPALIQINDWIEKYFLRKQAKTSTDQLVNCLHVQKIVVLATCQSFVDCKIESGGVDSWYYLFKGQQEFLLIEPTNHNLMLYKAYVAADTADKTKEKDWFGSIISDQNPETIYQVTLREGQVLVVPAGYIYSVYTVSHTLAFTGCFMYNDGASVSL
jgi:Cupin